MFRTAALAAALTLTAAVAQAAPGWTTSGVNFREGPGTWHPVIVHLPRCAVLDVHRYEGSWAYANWQGQWGWVATSYVSGSNGHCTARPSYRSSHGSSSYGGGYGGRY